MKPKKASANRESGLKAEEDRVFSSMIPTWAFDVYIDQPDQPWSFLKVVFKKGDDVMLHSTWDDTDDVWIGRILQIRTTPDRQTTLVKVQWYWSRNDVAKHAKSFDPSQCAPCERVLSDDYDYVSPYSFEKVVYVHEYDESSLDPPELGPQDLFVRSRFLHRRKVIKPPLGSETCFCQVAYNPFPTSSPAISDDPMITSPPEHIDVMHFCPSLTCRKWYHTSCLYTRGGMIQDLPPEAQDSSNNLIDPLPTQTRGLRLLAVNPDDEVLFTTFEYFYEQESQDDIAFTEPVPLSVALELLGRPSSILAHLPAGLLTVAQTPIVRFPNAPGEFALGNVADVVLARRLVYAAVQHSGAPDADARFAALLKQVEAREDERAARFNPYNLGFDFGFGESGSSVRAGAKDVEEDAYIEFLEGVCDQLAEFGLLAMPRAAYWEEKEREYRAMEAVFAGPAFLCPKCRGAI